jgi:hypothetical protein
LRRLMTGIETEVVFLVIGVSCHPLA